MSWGGPHVGFRWDFASDVDFRYVSVREIRGENGTTDRITYFTGSSKSSNVQEIGSSGDNQLPLTPDNISRNNLTKNLVIHRNLLHTPSTNIGNSQATEEEPMSFDRKTVTAEDKMYVLWVSGDEDNTDLYLKISEDKAATFYKTINLSNNLASLSYNPQIFALGEDVYNVREFWKF